MEPSNARPANPSRYQSSEADPLHVPVLLEQVLQYLDPKTGESYLDLTAGYGGHARRVLELTAAPDKAVLVDRDSNAIGQLEKVFAGQAVTLRRQDYLAASQSLRAEQRQFDMILADLGVSSPHLDDAQRGFAIVQDGPLDMRMDQDQTLTAADIVNSYPADRLSDILSHFGEEPKARQIAKLIVQQRQIAPIQSTSQLATVVARAWPGHSKVHPATRTFQALRIAVNDELGQVRDSLPLWLEMLAPGGRLVVISFHSLEDRLVKQAFSDAAGRGERYDTELLLLTKRPVTAEPTELATNPRARSAKLRAVCKQK